MSKEIFLQLKTHRQDEQHQLSGIYLADMHQDISLYVSPLRWVRCNTERIHPKVEYWVTDLLKGCEYEFRVSAENEVGAGDPSPPSKPVFAKDPIGELFSYNYTPCYY